MDNRSPPLGRSGVEGGPPIGILSIQPPAPRKKLFHELGIPRLGCPLKLKVDRPRPHDLGFESSSLNDIIIIITT